MGTIRRTCATALRRGLLPKLIWADLFTFAINLWHQKFVTADVIAVLANNQHDIQERGQDFDFKKVVFEGVHSKEVDR